MPQHSEPLTLMCILPELRRCLKTIISCVVVRPPAMLLWRDGACGICAVRGDALQKCRKAWRPQVNDQLVELFVYLVRPGGGRVAVEGDWEIRGGANVMQVRRRVVVFRRSRDFITPVAVASTVAVALAIVAAGPANRVVAVSVGLAAGTGVDEVGYSEVVDWECWSARIDLGKAAATTYCDVLGGQGVLERVVDHMRGVKEECCKEHNTEELGSLSVPAEAVAQRKV